MQVAKHTRKRTKLLNLSEANALVLVPEDGVFLKTGSRTFGLTTDGVENIRYHRDSACFAL